MTAAATVLVPAEPDYVLSFGDIDINFDRCNVSRGGTPVPVTPCEYELLVHFALNPNRDLSRDDILSAVWSYLASPNTRTVDAHVLRLRQKLEADPDAPRHFVTVHRIGYRFQP